MTKMDYRYVKLCTPIARYYQAQGMASPMPLTLAMVYGAIETICRSNAKGQANPKLATLEDRTTLGVKTINRALIRLREDGFVNVIGHKGRIPIYTCTDKMWKVAETCDVFEVGENGNPVEVPVL